MYAIVKGGTRSLGYCVAEELAKDGYIHIILTYNSSTERAEKSMKALEKNYGISVFLEKGDLAQPEAVDAIFDCVEKNFGNKLNAARKQHWGRRGCDIQSNTAKKTARSYHKTIGSGEFEDFSAYDYLQDIYPKCFIRLVEKSVKIMEDGKGYILAVSAPGAYVTGTASNLAKRCPKPCQRWLRIIGNHNHITADKPIYYSDVQLF